MGENIEENDTMMAGMIAALVGLGGIGAIIYAHEYYVKLKQWRVERKSWQAAKRYRYQ